MKGVVTLPYITVCLYTGVALTREDLELLKLFDHNHDYGPCIGT